MVNGIAGELKRPEGRNGNSLSERLHSLPVCRQVEKPLLVRYPISDIVDDAQAEVDLAAISFHLAAKPKTSTIRGRKEAPLASREGDESRSRTPESTQIKKLLLRQGRKPRQLDILCCGTASYGKRTWAGEGDPPTVPLIIFVSRLSTTALAIVPASEISTLIDPLRTIVQDFP